MMNIWLENIRVGIIKPRVGNIKGTAQKNKNSNLPALGSPPSLDIGDFP